MTGKLKRSFNVDRVAKRFYKQFRLEQRAFLGFVEGIAEVADREWYSLLMLNRLMFVYFIQKKGFLDGDLNYLENRLRQVQAAFAGDRFYSFYRYFLLRLFHDGLARPEHERTSELAALLGNVPYLNGGLFDVHELEQKYPKIQIADQAFERIVAFFEAYQWHLDDRPLRADNEINPDVLGYIFEKYVNQKQMGAYYTKEDITEYIAKNTIIPFLFDAARKECAVAFEKGSALWRLLQEDPDRYIDEPVRKGVDLELPIDIAAGLTDVSRRGGWNKPADPDFALPTETWREHVARRQRCQEIRSRLQSGEVCAIDDLITDNLNIRQFARDVIDNAEGPELVRAFYHAIEKVSVLDPTCGSGAFLFAALNVLEPLYDACLERMHGFLDEIERLSDEHRTERYLDFRRVLERVRTHPSREYFILKSIVVNNLYGVDIMEEAVEICKLRLFLKLVSQIENPADLEPLPDVDFNVRAGNTLVGFATRADVEKVLTTTATGQGKLAMFDDERETMHRLNEEAEIADRAFKKFRQMQTEHGLNAEEFRSAKRELRTRLDRLRDELDRYLARQYGVDDSDVAAFDNWHASHQPFHWFVEFYGIMKQGGFDVIVGNPPYVEYFDGKLPYRVLAYETRPCSNLYPMVIERSRQVLRPSGTHGMIVPLAAFATRNMMPFIDAFQHWF
ncbi:MAG TPA: DNA methyltransferase, partial [Chloroflexota bacterium]|nr:DNA methyltransferase [Chloroflexota bacterium]